jgi:hypothetical protein
MRYTKHKKCFDMMVSNKPFRWHKDDVLRVVGGEIDWRKGEKKPRKSILYVKMNPRSYK